VSATTSTTRDPGSTLDALELDAWRGFLRTHATLSRELDAELAREHDLPLGSYEVLLFLADTPGGKMRMAELADSVLLSRSGLTRMVDRMERQGLVRREPCPGDARGLNAVITDPGRERFAAARRTHLEGVRRRFLDRLSDGEKRDLASLWTRFGANAEDGGPAC
jgi:DNA-binding MarR family transcriptional regulator